MVQDVSFDVDHGETVALVGESGSGKSVTARAIVGLLARQLVSSGSVRWRGTEILGARESELRRLRGTAASLLLQDPFTLLNPLSTVARSLGEGFISDGGRSRGDTVEQDVAAALDAVGIDPAVRTKYPWELSGGMRQRVGLAAALARKPGLLIADEPTTALDATTQRDVLALIRRLQRESGMALLLITHDLRVAMSLSDRIVVMSGGDVVEVTTPADLRVGSQVPYTRRLWAAELPLGRRLADVRVDGRLDGPGVIASERTMPSDEDEVLLEVDGVQKKFAAERARRGDEAEHWALRDVSLTVHRGRSLGVIGESGSGKTTLARCVLGLETPTSGAIRVADGNGRMQDLDRRNSSVIQCVFQDPYSSLNPSHSIGFTLREAIRHRAGPATASADAEREIEEILRSVELAPDVTHRRPETLSGGQRQRVAIARALLMRPTLLVCDEPVAALDLTVQSQVLHVLRKAQERGTAMLFITHDLSVARQMTDDVVVLRRGTIVEQGKTAEVLATPGHPYTRRLISSVPTADSEWITHASDDAGEHAAKVSHTPT